VTQNGKILREAKVAASGGTDRLVSVRPVIDLNGLGLEARPLFGNGLLRRCGKQGWRFEMLRDAASAEGIRGERYKSESQRCSRELSN